MAAKEEWYAIRTAPGSQRMARAIEGLPANRIGESIIERNLRNEGIDVYMPAYWHEIVHHRTNKIIDRRLPLLVGYAFVHLPRLNFEEVRAVDGVICFLRGNHDFGPVRFRVDDIAVMAAEELRRRQEIRREKISRFEKEKSSQIMHLRGNLRKILKKGRSIRFNLKEQAMLAIQSMDEQSKNTILGILAELDSLEAYDGLAAIDRVA
ncbi:transcription termination factor nusG [Rhizobium sp. ERR 922]|uniref:transcription termination/antitermination protein NusG n=1 Tax=unclassified Rhizobium TaxID=2613769 RepID=UPI00119F6B62|nr:MULTISPECIES: transcription termination/antitermination NusG family protein [unclassified Rhizobium]TWB61677.1 transcription termination factor nusG [Rhizobium sp. ERR 922]TWC04603.1 transcription termination factor nusG [Rhizobium sp. ERR 942]